ncbi:hypothetical protein L1049_007631 [Liquidambar formosana]|uniref:Pentatricopeptide repeat-containing protein n=1 Tax=Liquidambar formosana TaxID=63359 RepID=A0AAP0S1R9_LIQFO
MVRFSAAKSSSSNFLRKRRKWLLSPYKTKWHETFDQQQAMQTLQQAASASPQQNPDETHLLSSLIHSFTIYNSNPTPNAYHFVIKTLSQTSQLHHLHPVLHRLEHVEKFETPEYVFVDLIKMYGDANRIEEAIDVFFRIPNFRCVPSICSLNALLLVLCKSREGLVMVPQILLKSRDLNIRVEESSLHILIIGLCRIKKAGHAIQILNYMLNDGYVLDFRMCSLILSSLCKQKHSSSVEVMGFLEEMRRVGFVPDGMDCANVIKFLVKEGKGGDALDVLNRMKVEGIKPDIVCYTMVLRGVISDGDYVRADELFDELLVLGLVPDVHTYNVYIKGLCKQNNVEAGFKMLACMEELGCKPDLITYNALLEGFCKVGEMSRARELVREMELKGVGLNPQTYRIMIDGLVSEGEISKACGLLEEMLDKCFYPRSSTLDEIIWGCCQRGLVCKALQLLEKMVGKSVAPGARTWEALLLSFGSKLSFAENTLTDLVNPIQTHPV